MNLILGSQYTVVVKRLCIEKPYYDVTRVGLKYTVKLCVPENYSQKSIDDYLADNRDKILGINKKEVASSPLHQKVNKFSGSTLLKERYIQMIKVRNGEKAQHNFNCPLCGTTYYTGYEYSYGNRYITFCKNCIDFYRGKEAYGKEILTAFERNKNKF